jgi:hypothetical protein
MQGVTYKWHPSLSFCCSSPLWNFQLWTSVTCSRLAIAKLSEHCWWSSILCNFSFFAFSLAPFIFWHRPVQTVAVRSGMPRWFYEKASTIFLPSAEVRSPVAYLVCPPKPAILAKPTSNNQWTSRKFARNQVSAPPWWHSIWCQDETEVARSFVHFYYSSEHNMSNVGQSVGLKQHHICIMQVLNIKVGE